MASWLRLRDESIVRVQGWWDSWGIGVVGGWGIMRSILIPHMVITKIPQS